MKSFHLIGISGIGMSGLARLLHTQGHNVQGSSIQSNAETEKLEREGIKVCIGHHAKHIGPCITDVVYSSAVSRDNVERQEAQRRGLEVWHRSQALSHALKHHRVIAVTGSHGKTTVSSWIGFLLEKAEYDPLIIVGGVMCAYDTNVRMGHGAWAVVEVDESDNRFDSYSPHTVVVTNISPEHLESYDNSLETLQDSVASFVKRALRHGGQTIAGWQVRGFLSERVSDPLDIVYCGDPLCNIFAQNIRHTSSGLKFDVVFQDTGDVWENVTMILHGAHNVQNALSVISVGLSLDISKTSILQALKLFPGVERRLNTVHSCHDWVIWNDYAHHPLEVKASLQAIASQVQDNHCLVAILEPHRFTRLQQNMVQFAKNLSVADYVFILPVYAASEKPIVGVHAKTLVEHVQQYVSHSHVYETPPLDSAFYAWFLSKLSEEYRKKHVIFMGAGDILNHAADYFSEYINFQNTESKQITA